MKLLRATKDKLRFRLAQREKRRFVEVLNLYPCIPPAHQALSKSGGVPEQESNQRLLNEALAEQRAENKRHLQALLADPERLRETASDCQLSLSRADLEWVLQILNDIRVGSWLALGSPEERLPALTAKTAPHFWAMEMSGHFQMQLLEALAGAA